MPETTSALVAANATIPDAIALGDLILIGVMHAPDGAAALLRSPKGRIARLLVGESAFGVTVVAVDAQEAIVTDGSGTSYRMVVAGF